VQTEPKESHILEARRKKISDLQEAGVQLYPNDFKVQQTVKNILNFIESMPDVEALKKTIFVTAGRMIAINRFGKSAFVRFRDRTGQMQAYIKEDVIGKEAYAVFKAMDIGDFIGLTGTLFQTKTEEWTLVATECKLLVKTYRSLPEKFHGLKDPEKRYRQRYLDLIMNEDVREIFRTRSKIVQVIRDFLLNRDFLEVETPMMQSIPGGAEATPFITHHNALGMDLFLRVAPELYLKRLVIGGFERVFELNRNFRNEGVSTRHNPEFTMLEFYWAYATYEDLMIMTQEMFQTICLAMNGTTKIQYQGHEIEFSGTWPKIPMQNALIEIGNVPAEILENRTALLKFAADLQIQITKTESLGKVIMKLFDALVEPKLIQPTFITNYPVEVSPLSRRSDTDPEVTERFELFIAGREIANGFSELNDPQDQRERFEAQVTKRKGGDLEAHYMDEEYVEALEYGMPPTAGEGFGIDRLVMLFTNAPSIREVILFPHLKNIETGKK